MKREEEKRRIVFLEKRMTEIDLFFSLLTAVQVVGAKNHLLYRFHRPWKNFVSVFAAAPPSASLLFHSHASLFFLSPESLVPVPLQFFL